VELGEEVSVWFSAVIRGDEARVSVGDRTNVQDGCVLHVSAGRPCIVGREATIGHRAVVHGCTVADGALIGIGAVVLDGAVIGAGAVVAAGALVPPGMRVPSGTLAMGVPAKIRGPVDDELRSQVQAGVRHYLERKEQYRRGEY
jgi:carbonic anhydrase/acetyltransferase-like protein (isoleucine patch superfamily)